jgi:hypothetical protein
MKFEGVGDLFNVDKILSSLNFMNSWSNFMLIWKEGQKDNADKSKWVS